MRWFISILCRPFQRRQSLTIDEVMKYADEKIDAATAVARQRFEAAAAECRTRAEEYREAKRRADLETECLRVLVNVGVVRVEEANRVFLQRN